MNTKSWLAVSVPILVAVIVGAASLRVGLPPLTLVLVSAVAAVAGAGHYVTYTWLRAHSGNRTLAWVADLAWGLAIAFVGMFFVLASTR